jgi:hypothetical protein
LAEIISSSDAVVYATGADHIVQLAPANVQCFEYRHALDPSALEIILAPRLAELRLAKGDQVGERRTA